MKSILVIEDNADVRENVCEILELSGYQVYGAENGTLGVEKAIKEKPDLIVCDVMMPRLDGYGVLKILRANKLTSHIPFIFLTARVDKEDFRKGMGLGADDYITKPFDDTELLEAIEIRLERQDKNERTYTDPAKSWYQESVVNDWIESYIESSDAEEYNPKDVIYAEGNGSKYVYYVASGLLRETGTSEEGKSLITSLYGKGDFFGMAELLQHTDRESTIAAISLCRLYPISKDTFLHLLGSNRILAKYFLILANQQVMKASRYMLNQAYSSVRKKVAEALLEFDRYSDEEDFIHPSRNDLSMLAGVAKETLIRTLTAFKSENLIDSVDKKLIILDRPGLKNLPQ